MQDDSFLKSHPDRIIDYLHENNEMKKKKGEVLISGVDESKFIEEDKVAVWK